MIDQQTTDSRTDREILLCKHANEIHKALVAADADGFQLKIEYGWALNLTDPTNGRATPLWGV